MNRRRNKLIDNRESTPGLVIANVIDINPEMKRLPIAPNDGNTVTVDCERYQWVVPESGHVIVQHGSGHGCVLSSKQPLTPGNHMYDHGTCTIEQNTPGDYCRV